MKVAVCMPTTGVVRAKCARALNELVAHTSSTKINFNGAVVQPKLAFFYEEVGPLEYKRTRLALRALKAGADYHLLIDWDHTFPPDALLRLAAHNLPVVGANYPMRHQVREPSALAGQDVRATGQGVEAVAAVGLGFCLVKAQVFNAIPKPWFRCEVTDDGELAVGEDVHFCNQIRNAGIPIHVDHDLVVGHIAEQVLTIGGEGANAATVLPAPGTE